MTPASTDVGAQSLVPPDWDLPEVFRNRLGDRVGRQRAMVAEGNLLLVLHVPPKGEEPEREGRLFWRKSDGTWLANHDSRGLAALEEHFAIYHDRLEALDERENRATTAEEYFHILSELAPLVRSARHQHMAWQQARVEMGDARDVLNFRDLAYELERQGELLHTDAKNTLDFSIARRAEEQSKNAHRMAVSSHRLNVLVAFFFPIATLCGVFGTNLKHGLEEISWPLPFIAVVAAGLLLGAFLKILVTRDPSDMW